MSVEAPPSLRPRKKFCDITGLLVSGKENTCQRGFVLILIHLQAPYTDPKTNLRYHSVEIYEIIKTFVSATDVVDVDSTQTDGTNLTGTRSRSSVPQPAGRVVANQVDVHRSLFNRNSISLLLLNGGLF